jgi:ergothioneine biosynthesis protein EgtB
MTRFDGSVYFKDVPYPDQTVLADWLRSTSALTQSIIKNLQPGQEHVPKLEILNPPYWEFGHLSWFHEYWIHRQGDEKKPTFIPKADLLFNSSCVAHGDRWQLELPNIDLLLAYNNNILNQTLELLDKPIDPTLAYFILLSIYHQDMHNEAFASMWQTLAYAQPFEPYSVSLNSATTPIFLEFPDQLKEFGAKRGQGFVFDNEKWAHPLKIPAFALSSHTITNGQYLEFVQSQDKNNPEFIPKHWQREGGHWYERHFDRWTHLDEHQAVRHVSHHQAQQYCTWRNGRLPTEYELTLLYAAQADHDAYPQLWEWTSSIFTPFPGFSEDPYHDYSSPWFDGNHYVLKGWSAYTSQRMRWSTFRNFYNPQRADPFCGFRVCALE